MQRIATMGGGAIGCYLAAHLAQAGHRVMLITRPAAAQRIQAEGLTVVEPPPVYRVWQTGLATAGSLAEAVVGGTAFDLLLLTMKAYAVAPALEEIAAWLPHPPPIICCQNGIGLEEMTLARTSGAQVIAASVTTPVSQRAPGQIAIERAGRGLGLAPTRPGESVTAWRDLFQQAGLPSTLAADYRALKWSKVLLNSMGNATAALLEWSPGAIYAHPRLFNLEWRLLREILAVMRALGIPVINLPGAPAAQLAFGLRWWPRRWLQPILARQVGRGRGNKMPSFYLDLQAGKRHSEAAYHQGAVAQAGREAGVLAPINAALHALVQAAITPGGAPDHYAHQPERLLDEVARLEQTTRKEANHVAA